MFIEHLNSNVCKLRKNKWWYNKKSEAQNMSDPAHVQVSTEEAAIDIKNFFSIRWNTRHFWKYTLYIEKKKKVWPWLIVRFRLVKF